MTPERRAENAHTLWRYAVARLARLTSTDLDVQRIMSEAAEDERRAFAEWERAKEGSACSD